jgi:LysM repeat protein
MEARHRTPARFLALVALLGAAVALLIIISSAGGGSGTSQSSSARSADKARDLGAAPSRAERRAERRAAKKDKLPEDVYVVKSGDTLGGIAEKTGVPVERLQELNPGLDQFQLVAGQRIKLR